jgi:hypothetical protein
MLIFIKCYSKNTLYGRPEARAIARATGTLDPPLAVCVTEVMDSAILAMGVISH